MVIIELTRVNPDQTNVELTSTFFTLQRFGSSPLGERGRAEGPKRRKIKWRGKRNGKEERRKGKLKGGKGEGKVERKCGTGKGKRREVG